MKTEVIPSRNTLQQVHDKLLIPLSLAFKDVETNGFNIDKDKLKTMDRKYTKKMRDLTDQVRSFPEVRNIEKRLQKDFNVDSYDQVRELFFQEMELSTEGVEKTDGGKWSVNKVSREKLKGSHKIVGLMDEYVKYKDLYKMFIKPLPNHIMADGRVHSSYLVHGTVTGRPSCTSPNLQQVPRNIKPGTFDFEFDEELNIKHLFIPTNSDYTILNADYGQLELRILCEYSQDQRMLEAFKAGEDIHLATAKLISGDDTLTKDSHWRDDAKLVNFGIIYGKTSESLARDLNITMKAAEGFMSNYFDKMPQVKDWIKYTEDFCREHKYVTTMFGRVRRLGSISSGDRWIRLRTLRQAVNAPIQGTAVDYNNCSLIELNNLMKQFSMKSKILAAVHDNLICDIHRKESKTVKEMIQTVMPNPMNKLIYWKSSVSLEVDIAVGDSWATVKEQSL